MIKQSSKLVTLILISSFLSSCFGLFFPRHKSNLWFYTFTNGTIPADLKLSPSSFLFLNPDKTYTLDFGKFETGQWMRNNDTIILHSTDGHQKQLPVNREDFKDLKLSISPGTVSDFESAPSSFSSPEENPFSLQNNQWRIPAKRKENAEKIKSRLINHCIFWKQYFLWALNNNIDYVDVRSTPTPIIIYGNGFGLKNFDDLPLQWKNYFYDSADCRIANTIIENIFRTKNITWAHTDNKFKMFIGAFEQLENFLREGNKE